MQGKPRIGDDDNEEKPLLSSSLTKKEDGKSGILRTLFPTGFKEEFKETWKIAWAMIITMMLQFYFQPISTIFAGKLGKIELDAVALSNTLINVFGTCVVTGICTSCDTLFSQAYGRGNYKLIGILLQRALIVLVLALMLCLTLHLNIERVLLLIGQDVEVSQLVGRYLTIFSPGLVAMFLWIALKRYTQCQNIVIPHIFIGLIAHLLHAALQYTFLFILEMGVEGSAIAQALAYITLFIMTLGYIHCSDFHKKTWPGWNRRCLIEWGDVVHLGLYGFAMVSLEFWAYEGCTLLAGYLGITQQAAQAILFQMDVILLCPTLGLGTSGSIRCGQFLGKGKPKEALNTSRVVLFITAGYGATAAILSTSLRYPLAQLFSTDEEVIITVANIIPVVALYTFSDAITATGRGIFRGCGKQKLGALITFISYYMLSLPVGITLMFVTDIGILGVWWSYWGSLTFMAIVMTYLINVKFDWDELSKEAQKGLAEKEVIAKEESGEDLIERAEDLGKGEISKSVISKRVVTVLIFSSILLAGIILRESLPEVTTDLDLSDPGNLTTLNPLVNVTTNEFIAR